MANGQRIPFTDMSAEVFGKYQRCTMNKADGLWYSDDDFQPPGPPRKGALPSPRQDTPELTALARKMHEDAANALVAGVLTAAQGFGVYTPPPAKPPGRIAYWLLVFCAGVALTWVGIALLHVLAAEWQGPLR